MSLPLHFVHKARFALLSTAIVLLCYSALAGDSAEIRVSNNVARPTADVPPLGINYFGDIGQVHYSAGNLIQGAGFEPVQMRALYRVIEVGEDKGHRFIRLDGTAQGAGTSNYQLYGNGYFSGASMRAYRMVGSDRRQVPFNADERAEGGGRLDATKATQVIGLGKTKVLPRGTEGFPDGGWLAPGADDYKAWNEMSKEKQTEYTNQWRVYYEGDLPLALDDVVVFEKRLIWPDLNDQHPRTRTRGLEGLWKVSGGECSHVAHTGTLPPDMDGGESCMKIHASDSGPVVAWHKLFAGTRRDDLHWYGQLEPGVTYRYEGWVRQEGGSLPANVTLAITNSTGELSYGAEKIEQSFPLDKEWRKVGFEFTAPDRPDSGQLFGPSISFAGPGTVCVDNVKLQPVYEPGDAVKPFVVNKTVLEGILKSQPASGRKGALRFWSGLTYASMRSWLGWNMDSARMTDWISGVVSNNPTTLPKSLMILEATGDSPETRMVPWMVVQVTFDEEELAALAEYLAVPYDPATDTPENKPYAFLRTQQRGTNAPWTDTFRELIIEWGNENWHNRKLPNAPWLGFGRFGAVHQFGREYGLFTRRFIETMKGSPGWTPAAEAKIKFCLGGNYFTDRDAYGNLATLANGLNSYLGMANYVGPKWEMNEAGIDALNDEGFKRSLVAAVPLMDSWSRQEDTLAAIGGASAGKLQMVAYEGGPSGFDQQAKNAAAEIYGKSQAMAVSAFDAWMTSYLHGWTYQCYLGFEQGKKWASHTSMAEGFRPSPAFLALTLRNRVMSGDLLKVELENAPVEPIPIPVASGSDHLRITDVPMLNAFAMRDRENFTVAVLSRSLDTSYPATIKLPFSSAKKITAHTLAGDPRKTNLDAMNIEIRSSSLPATSVKDGSLSVTVPPGSITIYAIEAGQ